MIIESVLQPAIIKHGAKITDIASCSCGGICSHKVICAIDTESRVYLSKDAKKFTAKKDLSKEIPPVGLFSTGFGAIILRADMTYDTVESMYVNNDALRGALGVVKKLQGKTPSLEVVSIEALRNEVVVVLNDGTVVVSTTLAGYLYFPTGSYDSHPGIEMLSRSEMMIPGDKLRDSNGKRAVKAVKTPTSIILLFEDSNELAFLDTEKKVLNRMTVDVKVKNITTSKGEAFITSPDGRVYQNDHLHHYLSARKGQTIQTQPLAGSTGAEKTWTRNKTRVESLGSGRVKIYPVESGGRVYRSEEKQIDPVSVSLPYKLKNLTLTSSTNFGARVNIVTEDGSLFAAHFRW